MQDYFEQLKNELETIKKLGSRSGANGYTIKLITNQYMVTLEQLRNAGEI